MKDRSSEDRNDRAREDSGETINAVDMVRRIRDADYEYLRGKPRAERMAFRRAEDAKLEATLRLVQPH